LSGDAARATGTTTDVERFIASLPKIDPDAPDEQAKKPDEQGAPRKERASEPNQRPSDPNEAGERRSRPSKEPKHAYEPNEIIAGKYQLLRLIGQGGMGSVWLARNAALDIDVAVKLIRRERATPEAAQRLLQEARAAARLGHPSIVRVFDFGESEHSDPFIVMEILKGESLRDLLARKKRLKPTRAVRTLLPIASALTAAHSKGIIHRDLKPDNILLVPEADGAVVPKVVDFGIAKLHQDKFDTRFTQAGQIMGSPGYMSPEQLDGRSDIDARTDVWTFAVVLYETLTGKRPFEGNGYGAMLSAVMLKDPTPTTEHGAGDDALWAIVSRGLSKKLSERWPTMREMGVALAQWAVDKGIDNDITGISLFAHWLHSGDGPLSDAPSAPRGALSMDEGLNSLPPPLVEPIDDDLADASTELDHQVDPQRSTPIPRTAESLSKAEAEQPPGGAGAQPVLPGRTPYRSSRPSPVLVVDPPPLSRRRLERPLILLAAVMFCVGIAVTWVSRSLMFPPSDPTPGAAGTETLAAPPTGLPSSAQTSGAPTPPPLMGAEAAAAAGSTAPSVTPPPPPTTTAGPEPTASATAAPNATGAPGTRRTTQTKPTQGDKRGTIKQTQPMPLPKLPNF
jgi:serine/threonine-protein kinase